MARKSTRSVDSLTSITTGRSDARTGRALELTRRFASALADEGVREPAAAGDCETSLRSLLDVAVPAFCDWCAIDIADDDRGAARRTTIRHRGCALAPQDEHQGCCAPALLARVPDLAAMSSRVLAGGPTEVWPRGADSEPPWCVVVGLMVNGRGFGTIAFAADEASSAFGSDDVVAAEEVARTAAAAIERILLQRDARDAVRRTQRIASQLHQLIAASITVASLRTEQEILANLANSTRSVFDADVAVVSLETGAVAPLHAVAIRGKRATFVGAGDDVLLGGLPGTRAGATTPWRDGDWLVAPILERRDHARGVVAIRRSSGSEFGAEDQEVLTLLAQMAGTALGAVELSRGIQNSEARLRILVETAPVGIVEVDPDGQVRWWNRAAGRIFAWPDFNEGPDAVAPTFPESAALHLRQLWSDVVNGNPARSRDFVDVEIGKRRRDLTASAALLPSTAGETRGILTLVDDVTDQRELKAELRHAHQMEIRGQVASSVAHDFNNLLTLISGYSEILSQDLAADPHASELVRDIQATASRASQLTAQLQTIGRTKKPEPLVLDPVAAIQSNAEVIERIVGVDIALDWSLHEHAGHVRVDADQFEQMILNLAINARDAMPTGGELRISLEAKAVDTGQAVEFSVSPGPYVAICVADTGVGMDEETRRRCFEPLFTTKGPFKGTGLGLAAARRLVEESGGSIRCSSALGRGTTFDILLPTVNEPTSDEAPAFDAVRQHGSATILLAEDDEGLRRLMVQVLRRNGYHVLETASGEEAIELAEGFNGNIDLLLSDVVMARLTGPELAHALQASSPALRVLLMSGSADSAVLDGLLPGTSAFLAKPFKPSALIDHIHELLARRDTSTPQH